ncbi:MAG: hypothetical protein QOJ13_859 [Gaiellales bacterium]|nr:hypothetical protein [Gaiellales bacterium]MDX6591663.1 hypothetical protein [Gaiellales bacterium]
MPRFGVAHGIYALAAAVVALAVVGGGLAMGVFNSSPIAGTSYSDAARIGQPVGTSFGSVTVQSSSRGAGLSAQALAGMTHGIQNFVGEDEVLQQVQVVISNAGGTTLPYSPEQFSVLLGDKGAKRRIAVLSSNVKAGVLRPRASIELNLGFVVPRNGQRIVLAFTDTTTRKQALISLGRVDRAPPGASHSH